MADIKTWWLDADSAIPKVGMLPAKANTITEGGRLAWSDASGYAIPSSAATAASKCWGIYLTRVDNSTGTTVPGNSGLNNGVPTGVPFTQGYALLTGDGSVTAANVGQYVFLVSDTGTGKPQVSTSDAGGTRPLVGFVSPYVRTSSDVDPSAIPVAIGFARPDALDPEIGVGGFAYFKARGAVFTLVAPPTAAGAFTVATAEGVTYTAGQIVLLTAQTSASQNGPWVVGTVTTGTAALSRPDWFASGATAQASSIFTVSEGIVAAASVWMLTNVTPITIDTTALTFAPLTSANSGEPGAPVHMARGVVTANIASLAAFTVASNDGLTYVQGQRVLLVGQTTKTQNGLYIVGVVGGGTAPLYRPIDWLTASTQLGAPEFIVNEGTQGANSQWIVRTAGSVTVDTTAIDIDMVGGNWVQGVSTAVGTMAAPSGYFFASALLKSRLSGIFEVHLDVAWSCGTTADTVTMALVTDTSAAGVLASANKIAHGIAGLGTFGTNGADWESIDTNAGAVLTYNGAAFNTSAVTQASEINGTLTGLLTAQGSGQQKFGFHGVVYNAAPTGTTKTAFTVGNTVAFGVKVTATNTITVPSIRLTVKELPSQ